MFNNKKVSVVFPAYNEEKNIINAVEDFFSTGVVDEIVVVDNNSSDNTAKNVLQTRARLVSERKQGYGYALQRGLREASGDLIIMAEPDGTFLGKDVLKLLAYADDFKIVLGTRTAKELIWDGANMDFPLRIGNILVAKLTEWLYSGPCLTDCGCTLRLLHRDALEMIMDDFTVGKSHFLPEIVILALQKRIPIIEIPVNYRDRVGMSKITGKLKGTVITALNMLAIIIKYKFINKGKKDVRSAVK
ncbi:MAG: glycosyltransferase family 2 protein [Candidatus Omnitrophota bacterium]|jgi:glycosyltransferase involved in cell wall biosynthesis